MFKSFFMAGFECATGRNVHGQWIDQIVATEHDRFADEDYALLASAGIRSAREAVRWPLVDRGGRYDFRSVVPFIEAARRHDVEIVWDLFHYGYPEDVDLFGATLPERFAEYCGAAARFVRDRTPGPHFFTPVNEPSYFAWAAGEVGLFAPHASGRGFELKLALARATLAGISAIRDACPGARIVTVDPICHVVAPPGAGPGALEGVRHFNEHAVFQFMDMLAGRFMPELGGSRADLDIVGLNYYSTNQWEVGHETRPLAADDPRRLSVAAMVLSAAERYGGDIVISETGETGAARGPWVEQIAATACELLDQGVALQGVCLYPILGMPEWHSRELWARMGAWDLELGAGRLARRPYEPMLTALERAQLALAARLARRRSRPTTASPYSKGSGPRVLQEAPSDFGPRYRARA